MVKQFDGAKCCAKIFNCMSKVAAGIFRQLASGCILLAFIGWLVFIIGFSMQVQNVDGSETAKQNIFGPYWGALAIGPIAFILAGLHILLGSRHPKAGNIIGAFATLANFLYAGTLSGPVIYTALFIFGASSFGDFEDTIIRILPINDQNVILGLIGVDNRLFGVIKGFMSSINDLVASGIEAVINRILNIPSSSEFDALVKAQFAGCVVSLFFLALSMAFWPFYSKPESQGQKGCDNKNLKK